MVHGPRTLNLSCIDKWATSFPNSVFCGFFLFFFQKFFLSPTPKCYNVTQVLQLQPLCHKGCNVCNVCNAIFKNFKNKLKISQKTLLPCICTKIYLAHLTCAHVIDKLSYLIWTPYGGVRSNLDRRGVSAVLYALSPCWTRQRNDRFMRLITNNMLEPQQCWLYRAVIVHQLSPWTSLITVVSSP